MTASFEHVPQLTPRIAPAPPQRARAESPVQAPWRAALDATGKHTVVCIPASDGAFSRLAAAQVRCVQDGRASLRAARRTLRATYPGADLHRQENVSIRGELTEVWFAYRDGRRRSATDPGTWWEERGTARAVIQASGRVTRANDAWRSLLGTPVERSVSMARDLLPPALIGELTGPSGSLRELGELSSTAVVRCNSGQPIEVEYHAVWNGDGPGSHRLVMRSFAQRAAADQRQAVERSGLDDVSVGVRDLIRAGRRYELAPGERLPESLVGDDWAVLVISGLVRVHLVADTIEPTLVYGKPGSLLGTHWLSGDDSLPVGLQSVTSASLLRLDVRRFEALAASDPRLIGVLAEEGRRLVQEMARLYALRSCGNLPQRLAREILLLASLHGEPTLVPATEQQLADGVGSIRESVARALADFRRHAWLATTRYGLLLLDPKALHRLADLNPM
jgi:CRP-like cAMP-binding protein